MSNNYNNTYFDINKLQIENIKIRDDMSEYYKKMYDEKMASLSGQVLKYKNNYYDLRLLNENVKVFDDSTLLKLENVFIW